MKLVGVFFSGYSWAKVAKPSRKPKNKCRPVDKVRGEAGQGTWGETVYIGFFCFCFFHGFGAFLVVKKILQMS